MISQEEYYEYLKNIAGMSKDELETYKCGGKAKKKLCNGGAAKVKKAAIGLKVKDLEPIHEPYHTIDTPIGSIPVNSNPFNRDSYKQGSGYLVPVPPTYPNRSFGMGHELEHYPMNGAIQGPQPTMPMPTHETGHYGPSVTPPVLERPLFKPDVRPIRKKLGVIK